MQVNGILQYKRITQAGYDTMLSERQGTYPQGGHRRTGTPFPAKQRQAALEGWPDALPVGEAVREEPGHVAQLALLKQLGGPAHYLRRNVHNTATPPQRQ
eukprot:scaffold489706_cov48-Prasinocladus_malaysianus.AAC.1